MASLRLTYGTAPVTPASGKIEVYVDTDKRLKTKDDVGLVRPLVSSPTIAATPPASPQDGDSWIYNGTAGFFWLFAYDSSETTYKWKFVGGPPLWAEITTAEQVVNAAYVDAPTPGPSVTAPRAGDYEITIAARLVDASGGTHQDCYTAVKIGSAATSDADAMNNFAQGSSGGLDGFYAQRTMKRTVSANDLLKMQYKTTGGATWQWANRSIRVLPVRVI